MPTPIIVDCDPGHDDAIALFLALSSPEIRVEAVTTVAGNQTLEKTTHNARQVLTVAGRRDLPVASGCQRPLVGDLETAGSVHGESGLDGPELPPPEAPLEERHGVDVLIDTIEHSSEPVTLVPVGPLTNVANALSLRPDLTEHLDEIVLMGGSLEEGNVTPAAEFNVFADPEAAAIVFDAAVPVTMVGLTVTHRARLAAERFEVLRTMDNRVGPLVAELLDFYAAFHRDQYGWDAVPIHDACAVAHVIDDTILDTEPMPVAIETDGTHTRGATVCDRWGVTGRDPNARVAVDIDTDGFHAMLFDAIARY